MSEKVEIADSVLTKDEREWAFALEEALYGNDDPATRSSKVRRAKRAFRRTQQSINTPDAPQTMDMPTDFEMATHALIGKGNTAKALKRIRRLAVFKETYKVPDFETDNDEDMENAIESVMLIIKKFLGAYPDFFKSIGMDNHGRVTMVVRLRGLRWTHPPPFNHTEADRMRAMYCLLHALQPTIESVRRGTVWIADLGGVTTKPEVAFLEGCRKLLRDSYPIRVQDIPVVRCPPVYSGAFVGTYPFWSRHFGKKFVRVDTETLRNHFPAQLLGTKKTSAQAAQQPVSSQPLHRKNKKANGQKKPTKTKAAVVAPNGDEYENGWEYLDDSEIELEDAKNKDDLLSEPTNEWEDWTTENLGGAEDGIGKKNLDEDMCTKIERLVRMRFETERTFRVS